MRDHALKATVIEDDAALRGSIKMLLEGAGCDVSVYARGEPALDMIDASYPGVVVTDLRMPGISGSEVVAQLAKIDPGLPVLVITAHGDVPTAVELMRLGAVDILEKPFDPEVLLERVLNACSERKTLLKARGAQAKAAGATEDQSEREAIVAGKLIGDSPPMKRLREDILDFALADAPVLIVGETGVGKELIARCLHQVSHRTRGPFVAVNGAAVPEATFEAELFGHEAGAFPGAQTARGGYFQAAHGGVLFLDELSSLPLTLQPKLLRAIQERAATRLGATKPTPIDLRVLSAAREPLDVMCAEGRFREDLYFRLNTLVIEAPPLRARGEDALLLFERFAADYARGYDAPAPTLSSEDAAALLAHPWPGNVRELRGVAERVALSARRRGLTAAEALQRSPLTAPEQSIEPPTAPPQTLKQAVEGFERSLLHRALQNHSGDVAAACEELGLPRRTMNEKMARYGLASRDYK